MSEAMPKMKHENKIVLCPSCSEAVYRLSLKNYQKYQKEIDEIILQQRLSFDSAGGEYSPQKPNKKQVCIYAYQVCGSGTFFDFLLKESIPFEHFDNLSGFKLKGSKIKR